MNANGKLRKALHEVRPYADRFSYDFDVAEALHDLLPEDAQLHLRESTAHAEVLSPAEREMLLRIFAVGQELASALDRSLVAIP